MSEDLRATQNPPDLEPLWNAADPKASESGFRERLLAAEGAGDSKQLIELHTYIARSEMAQAKLAEARISLATAETLLEKGGNDVSESTRIKWLVEAGRLDVLAKIPSQARPRLAEAWKMANASGENALAAEVTLLMAAVEPQKAQQEWIARGIRLAEESSQPDAKRWLGALYHASGWKLFDLHQYEAALAAFKSSQSHFEKAGTDREVFVTKWSLGKLLRKMGRTVEALAIQNALLDELGRGRAQDGRVFEELAECLHSLKRVPEAQVYFEQAYRELVNDEWVKDNQPEVLRRLKELGKTK